MGYKGAEAQRAAEAELVGEQADVAVDALAAVDDAVVRGLVYHLTLSAADSAHDLVAQLGKLVLCLLLVAIVVHVAHRTVLALEFKNHPILHL